jgi:hypothetical protein
MGEFGSITGYNQQESGVGDSIGASLDHGAKGRGIQALALPPVSGHIEVVDPITLAYTEKTSGIIQSVLSDGLIPGASLYEEDKPAVLSSDAQDAKHLPPVVFGRRHGPDSSYYEAFLKDDFSVLRVLWERQGEEYQTTKDLPREVLEDRMGSSFVVVAPFEGVRAARSSNPIDEEAWLWNLPPDAMGALLVPEKVLETSRVLFDSSHVPVVPVGNTTEIFSKASAIPRQGEVPPIYTVPNYREAIQDIFAPGSGAPFTTTGDIFVHGVRLPTRDDINASKH